MKSIKVISLGGSLIIPDKVNSKLLTEFRKILLKNINNYKFVVVCGGGSIARDYINAIDIKGKLGYSYQSRLGIKATRFNALFMTYFFNGKANDSIPKNIKEISNHLAKQDIVFCGALRYAEDETSDSTSAKIAYHLKADFINLTDVDGLYNKNPKKYENATFIADINYNDFSKLANKIKFTPGQHFILDQTSAKIIKKYKIPTFILGPNLIYLDNLLNNKHYVGTKISD